MAGAADADRRIEGLCTWRALLMLGGLLLHATMGEEHRPVFAAINLLSGSFRMGAFFMISGLLSGFALQRRADAATWLRRRMTRLGVPTLFGVAVICPITTLLLACGAQGCDARSAPLNVYHLWFMISLLGYSWLAYAVHQADRRWTVFDRVGDRLRAGWRTQLLVLLGIGTASFVLVVVTLRMVNSWMPRAYGPLTAELPLAVGYAPMFLFGFASARISGLRRLVTTGVRVPVAILALAILAHLCWRCCTPPLSPGAYAWGDNMLLIGATAWCPPAAAALILRSATAIRRVPELFRRLSDASFTMYMLHYPIIVAAKRATAPLALGPWIGFAVAVAAGGVLSYVFHAALVARSATLSLLLNGRHASVPARRAVPA